MKRNERAKRTVQDLGVGLIRTCVITLMESIPELCNLTDEKWFDAEDRITKLIEEIIKENAK